MLPSASIERRRGSISVRIARVGDDQRHVVLLPVGGRALSMRAMGAAKLATARRHHHDGVVRNTRVAEFAATYFFGMGGGV